MKKKEVFISVDVETTGPIVGEHSMLSIGACLVNNPEITFYKILQPITNKAIKAALDVSGFTLDFAYQEGVSPKLAMTAFKEWIQENIEKDTIPVFVGLNAPFDWSFINYYFLKYLDENPFGISALDIKALFMGRVKCSWQETKSSIINEYTNPKLQGNHNALDDAKYQAELFKGILDL